MRQLTYVGPKQVEWREVAPPQLQSGRDAIVQPMAVARCDLDHHIAMGNYRTSGPFALGHETSGIVVDVGDKVESVQPGDRVIVPFQINCGKCSNCRRGWTNACENEAPYAAFGLGTHPDTDYGGGLSDVIRVPYADVMLVPIPDNLSFTQACGLPDNIADGFRTVAPFLRQFPKQEVLVVGGLAHSIGLYAAQSALALGASKVLYVDNNAERLQIAKQLGAKTHHANFTEELSTEKNYLISVDANCTPAGMAYAIRSTAPCGFCTSVSGGLTSMTELPLSTAYLKGIQYNVSRVHARATLPQLLEQVCCGNLNPLAVEPREVNFNDAAEAMLEPSIKMIFTRSD